MIEILQSDIEDLKQQKRWLENALRHVIDEKAELRDCIQEILTTYALWDEDGTYVCSNGQMFERDNWFAK